jgi:hypothetical protein
VGIDFHLDFSVDHSHLDLLEVCRLTEATGWGGRVAIGHVTKLSAVPPARLTHVTPCSISLCARATPRGTLWS